MNWYDWPSLVFLVAFVVSLSPSRRWSHYILAFAVAFMCAIAATGLTLIVWGVVR